ncbi:MAG: retroviral-like aspartic protease family protein [Chloroflexi bacterium]|nr:retroviral-like aspartic protease family protein [Chloroflexota bacterium]
MPLTLRFQEIPSKLFGRIYRPVADVDFKHKTRDIWIPIRLIIDTGADYSVLPRSYALPLGIDLERDCQEHWTIGIGGSERIFLYQGQQVRLGKYARIVPVGFLDREIGPALFGRHEFLETFKAIFADHTVRFVNPRPRKARAR